MASNPAARNCNLSWASALTSNEFCNPAAVFSRLTRLGKISYFYLILVPAQPEHGPQWPKKGIIMDRKHLVDELIEKLAFAPKSATRYQIFDSVVMNLAIMVGPIDKSFVLIARSGLTGNTIIHLLGKFPKMNAEAARIAAHKLNKQIAKGVDMAIAVGQARRAEVSSTRSTFESVMLDYLAYLPFRKRNLSAQKDINFIMRYILNPAANPWLNKPISIVSAADVATLVNDLNARAPARALKSFSCLKKFFRWAMDPATRLAIGLERNPIQFTSARELGLERKFHQRVFQYEEVYAFLKATNGTPYPCGPCWRVLLETGRPFGLVSSMRKSQLDLDRNLWVIPDPHRKSASSHAVPLSDSVVQFLRSVLDELPAGHGDFIFSFTGGQTPIGDFGSLKRSRSRNQTNSEADLLRGRFERLMQETLEELNFEYEPWVWHDVLRTVRAHLRCITDHTEVAEAAIGRFPSRVTRDNPLGTYRSQVRRVLNMWSDLLRKVEERSCSTADWERSSQAF